MKLVVFLGNVGTLYKNTRHNAGWLFYEALVTRFVSSDSAEVLEPQFFCFLHKIHIAGQQVLFVRPTTLMNLSGKSLLLVVQFYKIAPKDIIIVHDDLDLAFGMVRVKKKGSSGGHNGVKDCIRVLGTDEVSRLKIGIKTEERAKFASAADFVLAKFSTEELNQLQDTIFEKAWIELLALLS